MVVREEHPEWNTLVSEPQILEKEDLQNFAKIMEQYTTHEKNLQ